MELSFLSVGQNQPRKRKSSTMKNPLPLAGLALLVAATAGTAYAERVNLKKAPERETKETLCKGKMYRTDVVPSPLKTMNASSG